MACAQRGWQLLSCEGYFTDPTVSKPRCDQFMYDGTAKQLTGVITVPQYVQQSQRRNRRRISIVNMYLLT